MGSSHADFKRGAISPSDWEHMETRFGNQGLDASKLAFQYNDNTGRWEAFEVVNFGGQPKFRRVSLTGVWVLQ